MINSVVKIFKKGKLNMKNVLKLIRKAFKKFITKIKSPTERVNSKLDSDYARIQPNVPLIEFKSQVIHNVVGNDFKTIKDIVWAIIIIAAAPTLVHFAIHMNPAQILDFLKTFISK